MLSELVKDRYGVILALLATLIITIGVEEKRGLFNDSWTYALETKGMGIDGKSRSILNGKLPEM